MKTASPNSKIFPLEIHPHPFPLGPDQSRKMTLMVIPFFVNKVKLLSLKVNDL